MIGLIAITLLFPATARADASEEMTISETASATEQAWNSSASVTVLAVDSSLPMSTTVATLIDRAPGVRLQSFGDQDGFSGVSIRGSTMRQVSVYLDGIPLNPEGGQAVNLSEWPISAFERVEVYRGNAPGRLGGAAVGGAINMVRAQPGRRVATSGSVNSNGRLAIDAYTEANPRIADHQHHVSAFMEAVVNKGQYTYFSDNGTPYNRLDDQRLLREHNRSSTFHALLGWQTAVGTGKLDIIDAWMAKGAELPGHINNPAVSARLDTHRNLLGVRYTPSISGHRSHAVAWWLNRSENYDDRLDELGLGTQDLAQYTRSLGLRLHDLFSVTDTLSLGLTAGLRSDTSSAEDRQTGAKEAGHSRLVETLTVEAPLEVGALRVTPVAHGTFLQHKGSQNVSAVDPRLGVRYLLTPGLSIRGNAGRYLRPPDPTELFGDRGTLIGNPDLRPERGWQWDIGLRARGPIGAATDWTADVGHFWNSGQDRITWIQNSQRTMIPVNFGKTWVQGLEAAIQGEIIERILTDSSVTIASSRNLDEGSQIANNALPSTPRVSVWHSTSIVNPDRRFRLTHSIRHIEGSFLDATNWIRTAPRTTQDIAVQVRPNPRWPIIEVGVQNLLDTITDVVPENPLNPANSTRRVEAVTDFGGHPLPGRTWTLSLRWRPGEA